MPSRKDAHLQNVRHAFGELGDDSHFSFSVNDVATIVRDAVSYHKTIRTSYIAYFCSELNYHFYDCGDSATNHLHIKDAVWNDVPLLPLSYLVVNLFRTEVASYAPVTMHPTLVNRLHDWRPEDLEFLRKWVRAIHEGKIADAFEARRFALNPINTALNAR